MATAETARTGSRRAAVVIAAVVLSIICLATWGSIAAVRAIDSAAARAPAEQMVRAVPATYQPAVQAAPVARAVALPMGNWTWQRGQRIARRALQWRNWPYSFGAGGPAGPSYGHAVDKDSRNDGKVFGFDCSGLTMYALAPWLNLDHDAAAQYSEVGSFHPSIDSLQPGDLVFWSQDGTVGGIGHVAVYVGDGQVVQAPRSGDVIRVTPIYQVESGAMGATRPLT
ncbi:MAG TPA: NlpC/P60 family protein [Jatrophihabitans sp.]|nr:NlpC/P60 family protein [Jatrophihabitans sp.]